MPPELAPVVAEWPDPVTLTIRQDDAEMLHAHLCNDIPPGVEGGWRDRILDALEDGFVALDEAIP